MAIAASQIVGDVVTVLQDSTNVRWPVAELCGYFNDGQRAEGTVRPDALVKTATLTTIAGTRQTLPNDGVKLIDITRNSSGNKRAVRMVSREILDSQIPGWNGLTGKAEIVHFMYDPRDPLVYRIYPPSDGTATLEGIYGAKPTDIAIPAPGAAVSDVVGNFSLPDQFANPLRDYMVARAYMKDAEYAANVDRARMHLQLFADQLGIELSAAIAVMPRSDGSNPNLVTQRTPSA